MAISDTAVLLRDGPHATANTRYALKAEQVSVSIVKTPIQIPIPRNSPELIDIGIFRPSITISGLVDDVGGSTSTSPTGFEGMSVFAFTRSSQLAAQNYYIPYKNKLEETAYHWLAQESSQLELEVGDASFQTYGVTGEGVGGGTTQATGGAIYQVAIQQFRVQQDAAKEDRWQYTFQFVAKARKGVSFSG
jgi:hypothetical protein